MTRLFLFLFLLLSALMFLLFSCGKKGNVRWMYYEETYCADRWEYTNINEVQKERVMEYLAAQNIKVYEVEIFNHTEPDECKACTCKTGRRYKAKIKKSDVKAAEREGFYQ